MNPIIRVLMCEIVGKAVLFGYRSDGQLLLRPCSGSGAFDENLPFG